MKRFIAIVLMAMVLSFLLPAHVDAASKCKVKAAKVKTVKVVKMPKASKKAKKMFVKVKCDACIDGKHKDCPYWVGDRHMTEQEIQDFEIMEMRYSPEEVESMTQDQKNALTPWWVCVDGRWATH